MEAGSKQITCDGRRTLSSAEDRDGIQDQIVLLNQLSVKLDEYFALRTFGPDDGRVG
ncbi:hypothetical protein [uncultured Methanoregula sp.]|uniref:hypothetical protein n=1 Tax=uncultured Methanoregula sp. TaxID=1005933 RepID=UPI002AAB5F2C|nr:hypothetical protein [uncultured Methanoregula sp.]